MATDVNEFIGHLDGGVIASKMASALSRVAAGVVVHEKTGKIILELTIKQIGSGNQVMIDHKLTHNIPTSKGNVIENSLTGTPMHVGSNGDMSLMPPNQEDMWEKKGDKVSHLKAA